MKKPLLLFIGIVFSFRLSFADEGMWIPSLLKVLNEADMQKMGCKLSAEDIYSINKSSLKDAVLQFGGGCTAEMISNEGLLITNHHCGYWQIQSHSTLEHNYLADGFWAKERKDELPCPGLTATFIIRIEDVTAKILDGIDGTSAKRDSIILAKSTQLEKEAAPGTHYTAKVRPFYYGNEYYLFIMETFKDVRMVGAPPESIGKFGGDTDNWIWPRHTGDFSLFRIYTDKENKPAEYSIDNVPFKPRYFFPISLKGVKDNDFAMVFGFPGRTTEYLPSYAIELIQNVSDPIRVKARTEKLAIWNEHMKIDPRVRLQYASKYAGVSNYHKKWMGEIHGLERSHAIEEKQLLEKKFTDRLSQNPEWEKQYGSLLSNYKTSIAQLSPTKTTLDYFTETINAVEIIKFASGFKPLAGIKPEELSKKLENLKAGSKGFYKNYSAETDKKVFVAMLTMYRDNVTNNMHPEFYEVIRKKYRGNIENYADMIFKKSIFASEGKLMSFLNHYKQGDEKKLMKDPAFILADEAYSFYAKNILSLYKSINNNLDILQRTYMEALRLVIPERRYYPDANSTLRVSYGKIEGYDGNDGVHYYSHTTLDGVMEKEDSTNTEFFVPRRLKYLYKTKDYGQYADADGKMHINLISSQHTTGGNSGSPLIDGEGRLIGINFDRNWEGTANDIHYDDSQGRSIILDIRYALFIIDKFAGATNLIQEMSIVK